MTLQPSPPRVLVSAFAFSPQRGSEAAVGWNLAHRLAKQFNVTVLTGDVSFAKRGESELRDYFSKNEEIKGLSVIYVPPSIVIGCLEFMHRLPGCWMIYYLAYNLWQKKAFQLAKKLHIKNCFSLCHQLTYIGYREPGYLGRLGIPVVWGPVSGAEEIPIRFYSEMGIHEIFRPLSRDICNRISRFFPGRVRKYARSASKIFVVSESEKKMIASWGVESELMLETGTSRQSIARREGREKNQPIRFVWSGLCVARKALPIAFYALDDLRRRRPDLSKNWHLTVVGDGPLRGIWESMGTKILGTNQITWTGRLERERAMKVVSECDVLIHTGLREGTPHVVLEALSLGLPVICQDCGGMGTAIDNRSGIKVALLSQRESIKGFSMGVEKLIIDSEFLEKLSMGALERSKELAWETIADRISDSYKKIIMEKKQ
jgi:glycosyltransferase involved in cell wall biosynthesis